MADPTLADYLQGRRNPLLDQWYATPPATLGGDDVGRSNALMPYSEFDTPADLHKRRTANPPLGQHNLLQRLLSMPGQSLYDATVAGINNQETPYTGWNLFTEGPMGPFGMARAPSQGLMQRLADLPPAQPREFMPSNFNVTRNRADQNLWSVERGRDHVTGHASPDMTFRIGESYIDEANRGQGLGIAMYQRLIDEAHRRGYTVMSDIAPSPEAQRIYRALADRGYGVVPDGRRFIVNPPSGISQ
jgi:GNAT superfamily N-acetyltransferase